MQAVYASKINKEADDVKWKHNYKLTNCQCNIVSSGQLYAFSCLRYSLRPQKYIEGIFLSEISVHKNQEIFYVNAVFLLGCGQLMVFHTSVIIRVHILQNVRITLTHMTFSAHYSVQEHCIPLRSFSDSISLQDLLRMKVLTTLDITHITIRTLLYQQETPDFGLCSLLISADFCSIFQDLILSIH